ncbi:hypothetical protein ACFCYB_42795, partial [Streptomyces sp. NPDC056309]
MTGSASAPGASARSTSTTAAAHYTQALRKVVEAKQEHRQLPQAPHPAARPGQLVDLMAGLGVTKSHSRPKTSNDNPYSESQYKTLKYRQQTVPSPARSTPRSSHVVSQRDCEDDRVPLRAV